ncbi:hypothetical protein RRG08_037263 [Elysia crispata]|uniref:Uncharacterized protein n=1 Tax=Elysia crispata TaxID=231223 RepID=A0AAE0XXC8_9GAST|nr:hypothetical protein RRG08_037263 [Elysia crispata]
MKLDVEQMVDWNESFCPLTQSKPATFEVDSKLVKPLKVHSRVYRGDRLKELGPRPHPSAVFACWEISGNTLAVTRSMAKDMVNDQGDRDSPRTILETGESRLDSIEPLLKSPSSRPRQDQHENSCVLSSTGRISGVNQQPPPSARSSLPAGDRMGSTLQGLRCEQQSNLWPP